jgi:hypothetical protein
VEVSGGGHVMQFWAGLIAQLLAVVRFVPLFQEDCYALSAHPPANTVEAVSRVLSFSSRMLCPLLVTL